MYVSQDLQGREGHMTAFTQAISLGADIVVDRMNFDRAQRNRYLTAAKAAGYHTKIIVLHESWATCFQRMGERKNHPTIVDEKCARAALSTFFTKYERPEPFEADEIQFRYPQGDKPKAVICDLDGTLCDIEHRRVHLNRELGKKPNWRAFFSDMDKDTPNQWCVDILGRFAKDYQIVFASGRPGDYVRQTTTWLFSNLPEVTANGSMLFMRAVGDHRQDYIVKEIILDFEILTRFTPYFVIDDRKQVVDMWRRRGIVCLQCDEGDF